MSRDEATLAELCDCLGLRFDAEGFNTEEALFSFHLPSSIREVVMERVSFSMVHESVQKTRILSRLWLEKCASAT